ncbi:hypothetical protein BC832DRAFT_537252 [Gaertneriomyces semiglobifer]|nr:hypothetical protein BC832DRAFT_537252 [Gaertneriomyces semiglobifer]
MLRMYICYIGKPSANRPTAAVDASLVANLSAENHCEPAARLGKWLTHSPEFDEKGPKARNQRHSMCGTKCTGSKLSGVVRIGCSKYMHIKFWFCVGEICVCPQRCCIIIVGISDASTTPNIFPTHSIRANGILDEELPEPSSADEPNVRHRPYLVHFFETWTAIGNVVPCKGRLSRQWNDHTRTVYLQIVKLDIRKAFQFNSFAQTRVGKWRPHWTGSIGLLLGLRRNPRTASRGNVYGLLLGLRRNPRTASRGNVYGLL